MTVPLDVRNDIRSMDADGVPRAEIAKRLRVSRNTVAKYADMEDMSPEPLLPERRRRPALEGHETWVESVPEADLGAPRKQRHTAKRVFDRLVDERGYEGSYSTVRRFVLDWRQARSAGVGEGYLELEWPAGTCQADYGNFRAVIAGEGLDLKLLAATLPRSNDRQCVAARSQASECMCAGLAEIFERWGARPQGDGPRQRHRGGQDGPRRGHRVEAVLAVQGPLPLRGQVLQPLLRQREGLRRERRGVLAAQPPGAGPVLRVDGGAQPLPRRGVRRAQRRLARPRRQAGARGPRRRPRRDARAARRPLRRGEVGAGQGRQAGLRHGGGPRVRGRAGLARQEAAGRAAGRHGGDPRRPRAQGGRAAQGVLRGAGRAQPGLARAGARRQAAHIRRVDDQEGHAGRPRRRHRPHGRGREAQDPQGDRAGEADLAVYDGFLKGAVADGR